MATVAVLPPPSMNAMGSLETPLMLDFSGRRLPTEQEMSTGPAAPTTGSTPTQSRTADESQHGTTGIPTERSTQYHELEDSSIGRPGVVTGSAELPPSYTAVAASVDATHSNSGDPPPSHDTFLDPPPDYENTGLSSDGGLRGNVDEKHAYFRETSEISPSASKSAADVYENTPPIEAVPDMTAQIEQLSKSTDRKVLSIKQKGHVKFGLPLQTAELQVQILNSDGSIAYVSTRATRSSSNCVLIEAQRGAKVHTNYDRGVVLTSMREGVPSMAPYAMTSKTLKRSHAFRMPDSGREFEWRYVYVQASLARKEERLVLVQKDVAQVVWDGISTVASSSRSPAPLESAPEQAKEVDGNLAPTVSVTEKGKGRSLFSRKDNSSLSLARSASSPKGDGPGSAADGKKRGSDGSKDDSPRVLAQLVRNDRSLYAGSGGELVLEEGCTDLVPEEVVVATSLVMLKKEISRLKLVQTGVFLAILL